MAGRAVRLCRELTRELANSRAHTGHVAEQGAEHAEKLGQTVGAVCLRVARVLGQRMRAWGQQSMC